MYIITGAARRDLDQLFGYLERQNVRAAIVLYDEMIEAMSRLAEFPNTGHFRADITERELRFWTVRRWHIVYDPMTRPIEIVRVVAADQTIEGSI